MIERAAMGRDFEEQLPVKRMPAATATIIGNLEQVTSIADLSASELDRLVRNEGWHLFFMVPPVEASGLGRSPHSAFRKAFRDVVRQVLATIIYFS